MKLASAYRAGHSKDPQVQGILDTKRVHIFPLESPPGTFRAILRQLGGW